MADWHSLISASLCALTSGPAGLTSAEAQQRLRRHGPNVLERVRGDSPLRILWRQIDNPLIWVLLASAAVAMALGKVTDGLVVLAVVVLNSLIGFVQEYRASRAIEALRDMVPEYATALRDGARQSARGRPGPRRRRPAGLRRPGSGGRAAGGRQEPPLRGGGTDGRVGAGEKAAAAVAVDAAIGDRSSMAFGGTLVSYGTATGLVVATGAATELGRISTMLRETPAWRPH